MIIENSGWSDARGFYCDKYYIDTNRTDHVIRFKNGSVLRQVKPFQEITMDWNHDGDEYALCVAGFENKDGVGMTYWRPVDLVSKVINGEAEIDGIEKVKRR